MPTGLRDHRAVSNHDRNAVASWRARMAFSQRAAAEVLGLSLRSYQQQERGRAWTTGEPMTPPRTLLLACAAIEKAVEPIA